MPEKSIYPTSLIITYHFKNVKDYNLLVFTVIEIIFRNVIKLNKVMP